MTDERSQRERMLAGDLYIAQSRARARRAARGQLMQAFNSVAAGRRGCTCTELGGDAGAVVTRDLPSGVVAAGVPARVIRRRRSRSAEARRSPGRGR